MKRQTFRYVILAYAFFWTVFLLTGGVMLWLGEGIVFQIMVVLCSWTPTIALLVMFRKLFPNRTLKDFYISVFNERLNVKMLVLLTVLQILIFVVMIGIVTFVNRTSISSLLDLSTKTIAFGFFITLIQGATGEESGWRGYLQPSLEGKYSVIKASLIIGVVWGFWHAPLWFITSGYTGVDLILYIIAFIVSITSTSIIIGICYNRCKNLFVPIWIHFMFNFVFTMFSGDEHDMLIGFVGIAVLYAFAAAGYFVWYRAFSRKGIAIK